MQWFVAPIAVSPEAARALSRVGRGLSEGADAAASELRAAWAARPLGPGGAAGQGRRWLGFVLHRLALHLAPELRQSALEERC